MQSVGSLEREVAHLDLGDFEKIFPEQYYTKYAPHLKVLKFQKQVFAEQPSKKQTFEKRTKSTPTLHRPAQNTLRKVKLNKLEEVTDTIAKDKHETKRMQKFIRNLEHKLKVGPEKPTDKIRTPLKGYGGIEAATLEAMAEADNEDYVTELYKLREKKRRESQYVNFKLRNTSISASKLSMRLDRSIVADSAESQSIRDGGQNLSNTMQLHPVVVEPPPKSAFKQAEDDRLMSRSLTFRERVMQLVAQARSQVVSLNPEDKNTPVKYIMALNNSIRKLNLLEQEMDRRNLRITQSYSRNRTRSSQKDRDPFKETERIREQGRQMETLSMLEELLKHQQKKSFVAAMVKR